MPYRLGCTRIGLADIYVRTSRQMISGDLVHRGSPGPSPRSTLEAIASAAPAPPVARRFSTLALRPVDFRRITLPADSCALASLPPSPKVGTSKEDRAASTISRTATSTAPGIRAVPTISCCAALASVIHTGTASGCDSLPISPMGCKTKHGSSCTSYRRTIRNRSPACGWKRYRITTSAQRIRWVSCRLVVQMSR
jgi:hypothetical protein